MQREELIVYIKSHDLRNKYHGVSFQHFTDEELLFLKKRIDEENRVETDTETKIFPTLADFDNLYNTTISGLAVESRISYCVEHLDKLQSVLAKNASTLDKKQKEELKEMIQATQNEISKLGGMRSHKSHA